MRTALLLLLMQDPFQAEIDDAVRRFESAAEVEQALALLSSQLLALGADAANPIARRLAQDLRDGMASAAAPAFVDALIGRPDALPPLQAAFRDAATSAAGRIELAEALLQLDDAMSWRAGLLVIASDDRAALDDRLRACKVLLEAEDERVPDVLRTLADSMPGRPEEERRRIVSFLRAARTPVTEALLDRLGVARPDGEEPSVRVVDEARRPSASTIPRAVAKKKETRDPSFLTMPSILAGGITLVLLIVLAVEILRKG